jgi:hypothetical protein
MKYGLRHPVFVYVALALSPLIVSCVFGPPPGSPETGYTITGFVGESPEAAAQNETVYLLDGRTDAAIANVGTNFFGKYTFSALPPALYIVQVRDKKWGVLIEDRSERLDIDLSAPDGTMDYTGRYAQKGSTPKGEIKKSGPESVGADPVQTQSSDNGWPPAYARPQGNVPEDNPGAQALLYKFAGRWDHVTTNTLTNLFLKPDGTYEEAYESGYSGQFADQGGYQTGHWGAAGEQQSRGRWKVVGGLRQGKLYLVDQNGRQNVYEYQVHIERGEVFWGEYFFNGKLYSVKYIYR